MSAWRDRLRFLIDEGYTESALEMLDDLQAHRIDEDGYKGKQSEVWTDGRDELYGNTSDSLIRWALEEGRSP